MSVMKIGLLANHDFVKLWIGQFVSQMGAQITLLALPLAAVQILHATPLQMGILRAAEYLPFILFGLFAGVLTDRVERRMVLVASDLARALLLMAIPVAVMQGNLPIELMYTTAFLVGVASVFFDVAYWSYLPSLVARNDLVNGNSKLALSQSTAEALGPGAAGILVQLLTAPLSIALNAASFLLSALSLMMIERKEAAPTPGPICQGVFATLSRGLLFVLGETILRSLLLRATLWNFLYNVAMPILLLYCMQIMALSATYIGLLFTAMGLGLAAGAILMETVLSRYGVGVLICGSMLTAAIGACGIAIPVNNATLHIALLASCLFVIGAANAVYNINNVSLRQALTPPELLGQMTAAMRFVSWGIMPFGALLGGVLGERIGFTPTLVVVGVAGLLAALAGLLSGPVRRIADFPAQAPLAANPEAV